MGRSQIFIYTVTAIYERYQVKRTVLQRAARGKELRYGTMWEINRVTEREKKLI